MDLRFINYATEFYARAKARPLEQRGKFIQVFGQGAEHIVLAPKEMCPFHANIAERFFMARGITGRYNRKHDHYHVDHPEWHIEGGGHFTLNEAALTLELSGESLAYGPYLADHLAERLGSLPELASYGVSAR